MPTPSVQSGTTTNSPEDDIELDECLFEPIYENASITVSGAFCAIMELKRKCRLPFTTIQLADKLSEVESETTLEFIAPMSQFPLKRANMITLQPGMYSVGPLQSYMLPIT